jgi:predicted CXXCH cytochrome family protein
MSRAVYLLATLSLLAALASAQEFNVAIGLGGRPTPVTIFDQIEDARERRAFRELWDAAPRSQMDLAVRFVDQYPRSIVLREAYELAARAFVEQGDHAQGLTWASRALHLMPENPSLLVMVGAVTDGTRHFIEIRRGDNGEWVRYPVDDVIGSKWQHPYATKLPDSRLLVFPIQYSRLQSAWVNYWQLVDTPGSPRTDISQFHRAPGEAVYQTTCAPCHTSQLSFAAGAVDPAAATFREGGVNCEMCHGPSRDHVERLKGGATPASTTANSPISFRRLPAQRYVAVCAQCHAQSAVHDAQPGGAVNHSERGEPFRTYSLELPAAFSRKAFYRDGRYRATTFISEAFARTQCFRKGNETCGSCHDPHPANAPQNPTSLKFTEDADAMCVQCHTDLRERPERHTRHAAGAEASRCVSCHMPRIMEAVLFQARSHEIDDIPDAEMTERFGNTDSPNAWVATLGATPPGCATALRRSDPRGDANGANALRFGPRFVKRIEGITT